MNMLARRMKTRKKGIEPIVAAILLIAIAIVAGTLLYLWVSRLTTSTQASPSVNGNVQVLGVYYNGSDVIVYVKSPVAITTSDVESVLVYYANNGTVVQTIASKLTINEVSDHIYEIVAPATLKTGAYYARIVTTNVGTITTPTFTVS